MATIYTKTAAGQNEIDTRSRRIPPRARTLLILVDGKRSDEELFKLVADGPAVLQTLVDAALVEAVGRPAEPARAAAPAKAAPEADHKPATADLPTRRRDAVRAVTDLLGPAAETLALRIERANDEDELRVALERAVAYIANARGGGAAAQFASRFLPGSSA